MASTAMDVGIAIPIILIKLFLVDAIVLPPRSFLLEPFSVCRVFRFLVELLFCPSRPWVLFFEPSSVCPSLAFPPWWRLPGRFSLGGSLNTSLQGQSV
jgi:hypothetical protein